MANRDWYVQVKDGDGNERWVTVTTTDATGHSRGDLEGIVANAGTGWRAVYIFSGDADGRKNVEEISGQDFIHMGFGSGRNTPPEFGTLPMGQSAGKWFGSQEFGAQGKAAGFDDPANPDVVLRSFLNQQGIGARSGVGMRAEADLTGVWEAVKNMMGQAPGYALPGASYENKATLANLLQSKGLQGVTGEARNLFNIFASGGRGGPNIDPVSGGEKPMEWAHNLAYGALIDQNPEMGDMIRRMLSQATDQYMERQRLNPEMVGSGPGEAGVYRTIRDLFGAGRFDPQSAQF